MTTTQVEVALDEALSDSYIFEVFTKVVSEMSHNGFYQVEAAEDKFIQIPVDAGISVLTKCFVKNSTTEIKFGTYIVQVALGSVVCRKNGVIEVQYCFAILYFNDEKKLNTFDFDTILR